MTQSITKKLALELLSEMEKYRESVNNRNDFPHSDYHIRVCESIIANAAGYNHRAEWSIIQRTN